MKKINKCQDALQTLYSSSLAFVRFAHNFDEIEAINTLKLKKDILQDLVDKEMYIELGTELHKQLSKPCYSSEDEQMIYLDFKRYYENWLAKYED